MNLANKSELLNYLKQNGLWAKKGLSQNFLVDKEALDKIVEAGNIQPDDFVIEIGPGVGTMTGELVRKAGEIVAVEMDQKLSVLLDHQFCHSRGNGNLECPGSQIESGMTICSKFKIINADILKVNLDELIGDRKYKVVANIPYHITSKILELFLSRENKPELMVFLVQKEVAERVCAKPGDLSILAISVQLFGEPEIAGIVPKESFFPAPKVDSAILKVSSIKHQVSGDFNEKEFFRLVHIGFASRRKTLLNNLSAGYHLSKEKVSAILKLTGFSVNIRAQELSVEDWKKLLEKI